jgi:hypothetical protein
MKKMIILALVLGLCVPLFASERRAADMIAKGAKPSDLVRESIDSSSLNYTRIGEAIDTVLRTVITARMNGKIGTGADTLVALDTNKCLLYCVPTTGVTSVTIKNISLIAMTPPTVPTTGHFAVWFSIKNMDATDSAMHNIITRTVIDTGTTYSLTAYRPKAMTIDSTANAVLGPGDAIWSFLCADTLCTTVRKVYAILNLSINK